MAKKVAPTKAAAGGGFFFENHVAAYFLCCLLSNRPPLDPELGTISRIDFQTRVDGWFLDDILLTLTSDGEVRHCALSVRSNLQFARNAAPREFVSLAWEQFLQEGTVCFERDRDLLGLTTAPFPRGVAPKLHDLLKKAHSQDPSDLLDRLSTQGYVSDQERKLFFSFACPKELAKKYGITETNIGELLKCIEVLEFDFEYRPSKRLRESVQICQDILVSGSLKEANSLWKVLVHIANEYRNSGGYLDLILLVKKLGSGFQLLDFPEHRADWQSLLNRTRDSLKVIPSKIGNRIFLPRIDELEEIEKGFCGNKAIIVVGSSGCGKTVIAKSWAEKALDSCKVIWWNARSLDVEDFTAFENKLQLAHPIGEILAAAPGPYAYVVIDGLDCMFSEAAFQNLSTLVHALRLNNEDSPWQVLFTCQLEEWNRIQRELAHFDILPIDWEVVIVKEFATDDLDSIWEAFPPLQRLSLQPQLQSLLLKPKILDLLATSISIEAIDTAKWIGESDLIEWFWETEVCKPPNAILRTSFLKKLGEIQGDKLESETPIDEFSSSDLSQADSLIKDRLCKMQEERLSFYHDLFGDWARQRILIGRAETLQEFLEPRIAAPLWYRAVRLYGLHLLERNSEITRWHSALISLGSNGKEFSLAQDLFLESVIFAADPLPILERMWPDLAANDGLLLRRLLGRFLHVATMPNPKILEIAGELHPESETEAATIWRIPYWPYWLPMIRFLYKHLADVIRFMPKQIAEMAETWLQLGAANWPLRKEAAELSLGTARRILHLRQDDSTRFLDEELEEAVYRATIASACELPDRVAAFALEMGGRKEPPKRKSRSGGKGRSVVKRIIPAVLSGDYDEQNLTPWPDGPTRPVDPVFRKVCLETSAFYPLILTQPDVASEVLLALLIEAPGTRLSSAYPPFSRLDLRVRNVIDWFPPFYTRGPFLFFLKNQSKEGLEVILRLVNFATERLADNLKKKNGTIPEVTISLPDGERKWIGDNGVYYWYRDAPCPYPVTVALMALEKWLYDEIDEGKSIDTAIELILLHSNSVAFAGLLSAVGRKDPSLFQGPLRPILAVPEFHRWELIYHFQPHNHLMIGWTKREERYIELARQWYSLPHREHGLHEWAQMFFLNVQQMRPFFEQARSNWQKRLRTLHEDDELKNYLEQLVAYYDIRNFKIQKHPEYGDVWIFEPPEELCTKSEKATKENEEKGQLFFFPLKCRKILNEGQSLAHGDLEQFWAQLQRISKFAPNEDAELGASRVEDAVCGGIAVLLELHRDWLKQYPEREKWCIKQLLKIIRNPPKPGKLDSEQNPSEWKWDSFCARSVPLLWVEDPNSPILRECMALLATCYHYKAVEMLFASAAKIRSHLGENFRQLQHFLLRWAAARWRCYISKYRIMPRFDVEKWRKQEVKAFVKGSMSSQTPSLKEISVKEPPRKQSNTSFLKRRPRQDPGLDLELIKAAFAWLPSLAQAINETERAEWINFWKEALDCTFRMLGEETEEDDEIEGTPHPWDHWVFARLPLLIMELHPNEHSENFWRPILNLGTAGHYWVRDFLGQWFTRGLSSKQGDSFIREWRAMVEFAFSSSKWNFDVAKRGHRLAEMWCYLMGFDTTISEMWDHTKKPIVRQMRDIYELWARAHLEILSCSKPFIIFLKQPAAEEILLDGLIWLEKAANQAGDRFWRGYLIQEELASLLDVCWRSHQSKLRHSQMSFNAFKSLLKRLADHQNRLAMELQDRVSRS